MYTARNETSPELIAPISRSWTGPWIGTVTVVAWLWLEHALLLQTNVVVIGTWHPTWVHLIQEPESWKVYFFDDLSSCTRNISVIWTYRSDASPSVNQLTDFVSLTGPWEWFEVHFWFQFVAFFLYFWLKLTSWPLIFGFWKFTVGLNCVGRTER